MTFNYLDCLINYKVLDSIELYFISTRNGPDNTHRVFAVLSLRIMSCLYGFIVNQYVCCKYGSTTSYK